MHVKHVIPSACWTIPLKLLLCQGAKENVASFDRTSPTAQWSMKAPLGWRTGSRGLETLPQCKRSAWCSSHQSWTSACNFQRLQHHKYHKGLIHDDQTPKLPWTNVQDWGASKTWIEHHQECSNCLTSLPPTMQEQKERIILNEKRRKRSGRRRLGKH